MEKNNVRINFKKYFVNLESFYLNTLYKELDVLMFCEEVFYLLKLMIEKFEARILRAQT